jgi:hypothetical protein
MISMACLRAFRESLLFRKPEVAALIVLSQLRSIGIGLGQPIEATAWGASMMTG